MKLSWTAMDSSNVEAVAYHEQTEILAIRFKGGALYSYEQVLPETFVGLIHAESAGRYLNQVIKVLCPYTKHDTEAELAQHMLAKAG